MEDQVKIKKEGDAHTARSGVQSHNELTVEIGKSLNEQGQIKSHMARKSGGARETTGKMAPFQEKEEERGKHKNEDSNLQTEDGKKSRRIANPFEEKGQTVVKQNKTGKRQDEGSAKKPSQYENIWGSEMRAKKKHYEEVWLAKEGPLGVTENRRKT